MFEDLFRQITAHLDSMAAAERAFWRSPAGVAKKEAQRVAAAARLAQQYEALTAMKMEVKELAEDRARVRESMKTMRRGSAEWKDACEETIELSRALGDLNALAHEFAKSMRK